MTKGGEMIQDQGSRLVRSDSQSGGLLGSRRLVPSAEDTGPNIGQRIVSGATAFKDGVVDFASKGIDATKEGFSVAGGAIADKAVEGYQAASQRLSYAGGVIADKAADGYLAASRGLSVAKDSIGSAAHAAGDFIGDQSGYSDMHSGDASRMAIGKQKAMGLAGAAVSGGVSASSGTISAVDKVSNWTSGASAVGDAANAVPALSIATGSLTAATKLAGIGREVKGFVPSKELTGSYFKSYKAFTGIGEKWIDYIKNKKYQRIGVRGVAIGGAGLGIAAGAVVVGGIATGGILPAALAVGGTAVGGAMAVTSMVKKSKEAERKRDAATTVAERELTGKGISVDAEKGEEHGFMDYLQPKRWGRGRETLDAEREEKFRRRAVMEDSMPDVQLSRMEKIGATLNPFSTRAKALDAKRADLYTKEHKRDVAKQVGEDKREARGQSGGAEVEGNEISKSDVALGISEAFEAIGSDDTAKTEVEQYKSSVEANPAEARGHAKSPIAQKALDAECAADLLGVNPTEATGEKGFDLLEKRMSVTGAM
jgi:hypothetical protein